MHRDIERGEHDLRGRSPADEWDVDERWTRRFERKQRKGQPDKHREWRDDRDDEPER